LVSTPRQLEALRSKAPVDLDRVTDIIIDHRAAPEFRESLQNWPVVADRTVRHILLVNPEDRASQQQEDFDAWLIRPLREKSLTDVLCGRLRGVERRDAINDNNHPGLGFFSLLDEKSHDLDVLVAEDDPVNARILRAVLEKSGCTVRLVSDFEALSAALDGAETLPDLIISDLNMPGGDGLQVLPRLCASLAGKSTPVMVLSGDTTPDTKSTLLRAGIAAVLAKPVEPKRLIEEVLRLFPQKSTGRF
jgi:CheY-like chemotaxis protein